MSVTSGGEMVVGLSLDDQMSGALRAAADNLTAFGGSAERTLMALARLGPAAAGIAAVGIALKSGVSAAADLQQQVANLNAVLAATPDQMQRVMAKSLDLSRTSQFTATQILAAQTQLAKAGGNPQQVIGQSQDVLNLASATFSNPTQAANAYIAVQKDFRLATSDSTQIVNDLAKAVDSSTGTLTTFMNAYKQIGPTAASANSSMHDTNTVLADLMNAGLGDQAGTAYKTFLQRIQHESPAAQAAVKELGLSFYDQYGQMRNVADIADQLRSKTAALTDEQKNAALYTIFGARGVRVADVFSTEGAQGLADIEQHMAGIGDAADIQATKLNTLQGQTHILTSSLNILAVQGGQTVLPFFQSLTTDATGAINALTKLNQVSPVIPQLTLGGAAVAALGAFNVRRSSGQLQPERDQYAAQLKEYETAAQQAADRDIALQQKIRNAELQSKAYGGSVGLIDPGQSARITGLEDELVLLRTKGALEAEIFRAESDAAAAGMARHTATMAGLAEEQAILERQLAAPGTGRNTGTGLQNSLTAVNNTQGFLKNGGDLVGLEAYKRDMALYEEEVAQLQAKFKNVPLTMPLALPPSPRMADYMPQQALKQVVTDVDRDLKGNPLPLTVPVKPNFIVAEEASKAGLKGRVGGALATLGSSLGDFILPVTIMLVAKQMIVDPVKDALYKHTADQRTGGTLDPTRFSNDPQSGINEAKAYIAQQQAVVDSLNQGHGDLSRATDKLSGGALYSSRNDSTVQEAKANMAAARQFIEKATADQKAAPEGALTAQNDRLTGLLQDVASGKMALVDAEAAWKGFGSEVGEDTAGLLEHAGVAQVKAVRTVADGLKQLEGQSKQFWDDQRAQFAAADAATDQYQRNVIDMRKAQAMGASDQIAIGAIFGTDPGGNKLDTGEKAAYTKDLQDLTAAWQSASTAVGKVDLSKGVSGMASAAIPLKQAADELARFGVTDTQLTSLVATTAQFKALEDATNQASAAFDGYMLTINAANDSIGKLGSLKKEFLDTLDAAEKRQAAGTATEADNQLIANRANILNNIAADTDKLYQGKSEDFLGLAKNVPDYQAAQAALHGIVTDAGGGRSLELTVRANTQKALDDIAAVEKGKYVADLTMNVHYAYPNNGAPPAGPAGRDYSNSFVPFPGVPQGTAAPPASSGPPAIPGGWGYQTLGPQSPGYTPGAPQVKGYTPGADGPGPTSTPNGDARILAPYEGDILAAAKANNIPPWMLAAIIMHESSGIPGIANSQGSGALGLTQIIPSGPGWSRNYTPEQMALLTGSGPDAAKFQIDQGAKIYADFLRGNNNDPRAALAAYGGNDPGYYDTLVGQYKTPVLNAIGTGYGAGGYSQQQIDQSEHLTSAQNLQQQNDVVIPPGSVGDNAVLAAAKAHLGQTLTKGGIAVYGWCEQIVDDILGDVNEDPRGKLPQQDTASADAHIRAAMAGVPGAGKVIDPSQAVAGDLVGWTGDSPYAGDAHGHIGVYSGNNKYIGTTQNGVQERTLGPGAIFIRPDGVVAGGPEPGAVVYNIGQKNYTTPTGAPPETYAQVGPELKAYQDATRNLSGADFGTTDKQLSSLSSIYANRYATSKWGQQGAQDEAEKSEATNAGMKQGLVVATDWARAMDAVAHGSNDTAAAIQKVRDDGGPIGLNLAQQLTITAQIEAANQRIAADKSAITAENLAYQALQDKRKVDDQMDSRNQTKQQWGRQDDDTDLTHHRQLDDWNTQIERANITETARVKTDAENNYWIGESRKMQDATRLQDFQGTQRKAQLQQQLVDLGKVQKLQQSMFTAEEQMLQGRVSGAGDRSSRDNAKELLAITKDYDKQSQLTAKNQNDNLVQAMQDEDRLVAQQRYDLQTSQLLETRKHEDTLKQIADESAAKQRQWAVDDRNLQISRTLKDWETSATRLEEDRSHQKDLWNIQDRRDKEDVSHQTTIDGLNADITANDAIVKGLNADLQTVQAIEQQYEKLVPILGAAADIFLNQGPKSSFVNPASFGNVPSTDNGVSYSQFPTGRNDRGYASGTDAATAGLHPVAEQGPELVFKGGEQVVSNQTLQRLLLPIGAAGASAPQTINVTLSFDSGMASIFDDEAMARMKAVAQREAKRCLANQRTTQEANAAVGGQRTVG